MAHKKKQKNWGSQTRKPAFVSALRCRRLPRRSPEKGKAATQTQGTPPRSPQPKQLKSRKPGGEGRRREEKVGWGIGSDHRKQSLLASSTRIPPSRAAPSVSRPGGRFGPRRRWTSSSISSSARPGESSPLPVPPPQWFGCCGFGSGPAPARGFSGGSGWAVYVCRCLALPPPGVGFGSRAVEAAVGSGSRGGRRSVGCAVPYCPQFRRLVLSLCM